MRASLFTLVLCLSVTLGPRTFGQSGGAPAISESGEYVFVTDQSTIARAGAPADPNEVYAFEGWFRLVVDLDSGTAKFGLVYAELVEDSPLLPSHGLGWVFSTWGLAGTVADSNTVEFMGKGGDWPSSDTSLRLNFTGDLVHLTGLVTPAPGRTDLVAFELNAVAKRKYGGGIGSPDAPFLIYTPEHMNEVVAGGDRGHHFRLMEDIDLGAHAGSRFNIIGLAAQAKLNGFGGLFDGNGRTISNFSYVSVDSDHVGLFAYVYTGGCIRNLTLVNPRVQGRDYVGALAGRCDGLLSHCYVRNAAVSGGRTVGGLVGLCDLVADCHADGIVSGKDSVGGLAGCAFDKVTGSSASATVSGNDYVGGLLGSADSPLDRCAAAGAVSGRNQVGGLVGSAGNPLSNCRSDCSVQGYSRVGGLAGNTGESATVVNCYATGKVSGTKETGGLIGRNFNVSQDAVRNSFWDTRTSGLSTSQGGTGLTTDRMQALDTYLLAGWDFVHEPDSGISVWFMGETPAYPRLAWEVDLSLRYGGGTGEPNDPYLIYTAEQLNAVGANIAHWDRHFRLMADIDLGAYKGNDFHLIGMRGNGGFTGVFNGNGKTVSNFTYISPDEDWVGLFNGTFGRVMNLGLIDPNVQGDSFVGSLAGQGIKLTGCYARGARVSGKGQVGGLAGDSLWVSECYVTGCVTGESNVGGLVGWGGGISRSFADANVSGRMDVGGLVGQSVHYIEDSYSRGSVVGEQNVGGLAGSTWDPITRSYSTACVTGASDTGGLVGYSLSHWVAISFWDIQATGQPTSHGGTGLPTDEMLRADTFLKAGWDFVDETAHGTEDIWWIDEGRDYPRLAWERELADGATDADVP